MKEDEAFYNECLSKIPFINDVLKPIFKSDVFVKEVDRFNFNGIFEHLIFNPFEGQIDTGNMMQALLKEAVVNDILICKFNLDWIMKESFALYVCHIFQIFFTLYFDIKTYKYIF